ncbi:MAG TPA: LemA [Candidatus Faecalibacterium gallistercoris]|uniref:LemA n=1 Tax=Candidatus Faecalibacterium gallistercoris TaxID=2838579 RepID=A0A9D2FDN7_9FIRM|nr:LemA [Candidatus Faecalibacterium gallistercoris]
MAQAEFERNKQQGGFDSTSYRAAEPESGARVLTPLQQKLAGLEKALPAALRSRVLAFALAAAVLAAGVVGIGGVKLQARANEAAGWYTVGAPGDNGYNLNEELTLRANTAANVITTALNTPGLGAEAGAVTAAQAALDGFTACQEALAGGGAGMSEMYRANEALGTAIDMLYGEMQALADDPLNMGAVGQQYGQFNSAGTILGSLHYNEAVTAYQNDTGGPWASVLKGLFGIEEVEVFG